MKLYDLYTLDGTFVDTLTRKETVERFNLSGWDFKSKIDYREPINGEYYLDDSEDDITVRKHKDKSKNKKEDKDIEKDNNLIVSKDTIRQTDVRRVIEEWNKLQNVGIAPIRDIKPASKRCQLLKGRIREYGMDDLLKAMDNIRHSDFLRGENKNGWMITFDWFVKPNNFLKVLEGNYNGDRKHGSGAKTQRKVEPLIPFGTLGDDGNSDALPFM